MFSSIPALYPLDASKELQDSENTNAEDPGKYELQINIEKNLYAPSEDDLQMFACNCNGFP